MRVPAQSISVLRVAGLSVFLSGPALAQRNPWGLGPEDFGWGGPTAGGTTSGLVALLGTYLVILVAYLWHCVRRDILRARAQRSLSTQLDRIYGFVDYPELLRPGVRVFIESEQGNAQRLYSSVVEDADDVRAELLVPREEGAIVPLRIGQRIGLVVRESPYSYRFDTRILARRKSRLPTLTVVNKSRVLRFQRREFLRVPVGLAADVQLRYSGGRDGPASHVSSGRIVDLSGCGLRVELSVATKRVRFFRASFELPDGRKGQVSAECRLIAGNVQRHGRHVGMTVGAQFIEISREDRERVIRYVRELERQARKQEVDRRYDEQEREAPAEPARRR